MGKFLKFLDDRMGYSDYAKPLMDHIVPRDARWWYVFGSATFVAFISQVITGIGLAFMYVPSSGQAYESLQYITNTAFFGSFLRGMHSWGSGAMVLLVGIHMAQVFIHGTYKYPREMNWVTGVLLLLFTVLMGFTGQLMRWDVNAVYSALVAGQMMARVPLLGDFLPHLIIGGDVVGGQTLSRFYVAHVFLVPACLFLFIGLHFMLLFRHGISEMPKVGQPVNPKTYVKEYEARLKKDGVPFFSTSGWRDMVFAGLVFLAIVALGWWAGPPALDPPPDPAHIIAMPMPDWYLLWYFAILALMPPGVEEVLMITGPFAAILVLFLIPLFNKGERHWTKRPWAVGSVVCICTFIGTLWIAGTQSPWSPDFTAPMLEAKIINGPLSPTMGPAARQRVHEGARVFYDKGCIRCHKIEDVGGMRGPDLTEIGRLLTEEQIIIRINNGGINMPAFAGNMSHDELTLLMDFLLTRKRPTPPVLVEAAKKAARQGEEEVKADE